MISLKNLTFSYPDSDTIFSDLELNINQAEVTILKGENGSGKTTFCRLIMGLLHNYSGSIKLFDKEVGKLVTEQIADKIVYIKQEPADNIVAASAVEDLHIWQHKFSGGQDTEQIASALDYFNLIPQAEQPVWELSSEQLKRIGLAALLLNRTKYWILDEPTAGLDN
jgi:ABC-type transport system involved in cytochrome c biogenesis ATPase subunit